MIENLMLLLSVGVMSVGVISVGNIAYALKPEPKKVPWQEPPANCEFSKDKTSTQPEALLREFLKKDSTGEIEKRNNQKNKWLEKNMLCPGTLSSPEGVDVITGYKIMKTLKSGNVFSADVEYEITGTLSPSGKDHTLFAFIPHPERRNVEFDLVNTPFGWRISKFAWHLVNKASVGKVLGNIKWAPGSKEKFQKTKPAK